MNQITCDLSRSMRTAVGGRLWMTAGWRIILRCWMRTALSLSAVGFLSMDANFTMLDQDAPTDGLVAYYPFHGTANDVWGGHDGELTGNLTPVVDRFAYSTNSLQISRNGASGGQYLSGKMSDLRIYSRALYSDEIDALFFEPPQITPPLLKAMRSAQSPDFSWPVASTGYQLQSSPRLGTEVVWENVTTPPVVIGDEQVVTVDIGLEPQFFRLRKP